MKSCIHPVLHHTIDHQGHDSKPTIGVSIMLRFVMFGFVLYTECRIRSRGCAAAKALAHNKIFVPSKENDFTCDLARKRLPVDYDMRHNKTVIRLTFCVAWMQAMSIIRKSPNCDLKEVLAFTNYPPDQDMEEFNKNALRRLVGIYLWLRSCGRKLKDARISQNALNNVRVLIRISEQSR